MFSRYVWASLVLFFYSVSAYSWTATTGCLAPPPLPLSMFANEQTRCAYQSCTYGQGQDGQQVMCQPANDDPCPDGGELIGDTTTCSEPPFTCDMGTPDPETGLCNIGDGGNCEDVAGYIDGYAVCDDKRNECEAAGGQLGSVNGQTVCVPDDYGAPECSGSGGLVLTDAGDGGFVCDSPSDNENGTNNEEGGDTSSGQDPNTNVLPENPENPNKPDPDPSSISDQTQLAQEALGEAQENTKELRKQTNQLGDVNKELDNITKNTDRSADELELQNTANAMPDHTQANTVGDVVGNFWTGIQAAPIVQAAYSFGDVIPEGGTCSPLSVDLGQSIGSISSNLFCELLDEYGQALGYIVLLCFAFASFRVFFSA